MVAIHGLQSSAQQYLTTVLFWLVKTAQSIKSRITTASLKHMLWRFELVLNENCSAFSQKNDFIYAVLIEHDSGQWAVIRLAQWG